MCVKGVWSVCYCKVFIKHKSGVASKRGASLAGNTGDVSVYRVKIKIQRYRQTSLTARFIWFPEYE